MTKPPYGYIVSPTDKKQWIVDEEAAAVVKQISDLCISGKGPAQIASILKADNVLIAKAYYVKRKGKALPDYPYNWKDSTIVGILERMDYCGLMGKYRGDDEIDKPMGDFSCTDPGDMNYEALA